MDDSDSILLRDVCDSAKTIKLNDGSTLAFGRNRETQVIQDTRCSRVQLLLTPNVEDRSVIVEHVGNNPSAINGVKLKRGEKRKIQHNDIIEVLESCYFFKLEFPSSSKNAANSYKKENPTNTEEKKTVTGSLDCFLKDSVLQSPGVWRNSHHNSLVIFCSNDIQSRSKVASFDLDGTLIATKSGHVFAKDPHDWKLAFNNVISKLKELHENNFKIVIFTNQSGIGRGTLKLSDFKKKIESIVRKIAVPVQVFIATMDDIYRKPRPGMWRHLVDQENDGLKINNEESFYCGDAAGRPAHCEPNKKKKDFAVSDRLFALNMKLKFFTPEEYFLSWKTAIFVLPEFCPTTLSMNTPLLEPKTAELLPKNQEIVIMIGCPGSGKTFFSKTHLESAGYVHVNRDTLKTWQKCVALTEKSVQNKLSVVVDNTNPDKESRTRYVSIAKKFNISCRVFWMKTTLEHAKHNNTFRQLLKRDEVHDLIPNHSLISFFKVLEPPVLDEGFTELVRVNFIPHFKNDEDKELYNMYLLD